MLLNRSIRRKLVVALGLLLLALVGLFAAALAGLHDYRYLVRDLEVAIHEAPRQSDLIASIGQLADPLAVRLPPDTASAWVRQQYVDRQRQELDEVVDRVRLEVIDYFDRLDQLHELRRVPIGEPITRSLDNAKVRMLETLSEVHRSTVSITKWDRRDESVVFIASKLAQLNEIARHTPPPLAEIRPMLRDARSSYHIHYWLVSVTGVLAVVLLAATVVLAWRWIYRPIKCLHAVAKQVTAGDFGSRAHVCPSNDELSQLARTLNDMIERFESHLADRDDEIHQRSQQLIQSARLADTGFLAAGIAHEVNNPLASVSYAAESLQDRVRELLEIDEETGHVPTPDPRDLTVVNKYLDMIANETTRIRELTEKMKDFGRKDVGEDEAERYRYDVTAIVAEVIALFGHMKKYAEREIIFEPSEPAYVMAVSSQIKQVVLNLIANALEAVDDGGRVEIVVRTSGDDVELTFHDNGSGMDEQTLEHIFDAFYTTKLGEGGRDRGTGLGLAICHRIVSDHAGTIAAESAGPGHGSTFRLRLPKADAQTRAA